MKNLIHEGEFTSSEIEVISNPGKYLNEYLQNVSDVDGIEERKMYHFAKEKFNGLIPKQDIKIIVEDKFKVLTNIRLPTKESKIRKLKNIIAKGKSKIVDQEESLRNLMGEPFHLIVEPGGKN